MANLDTPPVKNDAEKKLSANVADQHTQAAVHHSLLSDAYNYVTRHPTETKVAVGAIAVAGATVALRHFMPPAVAEKVLTTGGSLLERALGATPHAVQEFKVLETAEKTSSLVSRLKSDGAAAGLLRVKDAKGAEFNLLAGHAPLAPEAAAKADKIATCALPDGCADKGLFGAQKGRVFFQFDNASQTLRFSEQGDSIANRFTRLFKGEEKSWVPLGTQQSNDLKALTTDRATMPKLEGLKTDGTTHVPGIKETLTKWESQQQIINRNADKQDFLSNLIRNEILPELRSSGQISKDWKFFSTQIHSAADHGEADGIYVNQSTGDAHLVDFSSSPFKRIRPYGESLDVRRAGVTHRTDATSAELAEARTDGMRDKKIAGVRTQGLMGYDSRWFDVMGKLDVEKFDAAEFRKQIATQLSDLTQAPAYFKVGKTPFTDIVVDSPHTQVAQLEKLRQWSLSESAKPDSMHPEGYKEYAESLEKSMSFIRKNFTAAGDPKHFGTIVQDSAEQAIFRWAADRAGLSVAAQEQAAAKEVTAAFSDATKGNSNLSFVKEKSVLSFTHDGLTYNSDVLTGTDGVLDRSRRALIQEKHVKVMFDQLRDKQKAQILARLGTKDNPATEERAIHEITQVLVNRGNEIKAGGQSGFPPPGKLPVLIQRIQNRIQVRDVETLTRPTTIPGAAEHLNPKKLPSMQ